MGCWVPTAVWGIKMENSREATKRGVSGEASDDVGIEGQALGNWFWKSLWSGESDGYM